MEGEATKRSQLQVLWGTTYTMNPSAPWAEAVVVRDGRIVYVGLKVPSPPLWLWVEIWWG